MRQLNIQHHKTVTHVLASLWKMWKESSTCSCRRWGHWLQWNMYNSTVIASQHIYLVISLHKLLNKRVDECRQLIKIRVDHREGRVCISFDCHCQVTVIMSSKKVKKMFGPGPTGPYGSYAYVSGDGRQRNQPCDCPMTWASHVLQKICGIKIS